MDKIEIEQLIAEAREHDKAATPGPWSDYAFIHLDRDDAEFILFARTALPRMAAMLGEANRATVHNITLLQELIAEVYGVREGVTEHTAAEAIEEVERLRAEVKRLRDELDLIAGTHGAECAYPRAVLPLVIQDAEKLLARIEAALAGGSK